MLAWWIFQLVPSTARYGLFSPLEKALVLGNWPQPLPPNTGFRNWRSDSCGVYSWFRTHCNTAKWQSSFLFQGSITPTDFSLQKCFLPFESRVFTIYCAAGALLVILVLAHVQLLTPPFYFAQRLISKHKAVWRARHLHSVTEIPKLRTVKHQTIFMPANDLIWLLVWRQVAFTHTIEVLYSWYDYYRINN